MAVVRRWVVVLAAVVAAVAPAAAQAGGGGATRGEMSGAVESDADGATAGFDGFRKPPIPVSFLSSDAGWVQFQYPPSARERVGPLMAQADELRAELADILGQAPLEGVEVRVARGSEEISTLAPSGMAPVPQGSGVSYAKLRLVVLSLGAGGAEPGELAVAFRRELARLALSEAVMENALPAWLLDGFAQHFSRDGRWLRALRLYRLILRRRPHTTVELEAMLDPRVEDDGTTVALAESADLVGFLQGSERRGEFAAFVGGLRRGEAVEPALRAAYGSNLMMLERKWGSDLGRRATLATIYVCLGVPALLLLGMALGRSVRRRRQRLGSRWLFGKARAAESSERARVHIVFSRRDERIEPSVLPEPEIPKVEHEGEWHTLH